VRKLRVVTLFGTRPELIKLSPVLGLLEHDPRFASSVVASGQHREMLEGLLELFGIEPDHELDLPRERRSPAEVAARTMLGLGPLLDELRPDLLLVQGDTSSAFAGAMTAFYHGIPVGHVEAGLRSNDRAHPFPEEINRRAISLACDLHFAPLRSNRENLLREGVDPARIFVTGNTVIDALRAVRERGAGTLERFVPAEALAGRRLLLVTAHRRESFDAHLAELCHGLKELAARYADLAILYPMHLNPNVRRAVLPILQGQERIHLLDPLPYEAFVEAMGRSYLIVTDSGGIQEEAPSLGKPLLVFRKVTERGEGVAARGARIVGLDREKLLAEASRLLDDAGACAEMTRQRDLYGDGQASRRIVQAILYHFGRGEAPEPFVEPEPDPD
jgi:UDP-N-acetylglucosamine 2-epimerase (non-hydrolysing)